MASDNTFVPAKVESARIINVNIRDWSVDVVSSEEGGAKKYFDIQVGMPYFHYMNGEGFYVMPEVGSYCFICRPSSGLDANPFVVAFQSPFDESSESYRSNRPELNPGDMMMKTRDENFLILRRGGSVQIGATPAAQRMYIPARNVIRDFCENYGLRTLAGQMDWIVHRTEETTTGDARTELLLYVKEKANDPGHVVKVLAGSPGGSEGAVKLRLEVRPNGSDDSQDPVIKVELDNAGNLTTEIAKDYSATIRGSATVNIEGDSTVEVGGATIHRSGGNTTIEAGAAALIEALGGNAKVKAAMKVIIEAAQNVEIDGIPHVLLGGPSAEENLIKGKSWKFWMDSVLTLIGTFTCPATAAAAAVAVNGPLGAATPLTAGMFTPVAGVTPAVVGASAVAGKSSETYSLLSQKSKTL